MLSVKQPRTRINISSRVKIIKTYVEKVAVGDRGSKNLSQSIKKPTDDNSQGRLVVLILALRARSCLYHIAKMKKW